MSEELNKKKKEFLLTTLEKLYWVWPLAWGIYALVREAEPNDTMLDSLIDIIKNSINNIKDEDVKQAMEDTLAKLEEMKKVEEAERKNDIIEAEKILEALDF